MPTWSGICAEYTKEVELYKEIRVDQIRRKYLKLVSQKTNRPTILYATRWMNADIPANEQSLNMIIDDDIHGFMEVVHNLKGQKLNLILHSPGGVPESAEAIVKYLRDKFKEIDVYVPMLAMSAATMIACSANRIFMGRHSFLGPIDPQLGINTPLGLTYAPAQAILDQFQRAKKECANQANLAAWLPMLGQYGPHLLETCENVIKLSEEMVRNWLNEYMFENNDKRKSRAIAKWLRDHKHFKSHNRHISREELEDKGLKVEQLETKQELQDAVLSVYHSTALTFNLTAAAKIIENSEDRAFIKMSPSIMKKFHEAVSHQAKG